MEKLASALPPHAPLAPRQHEFAVVLKDGVAELENAADSESAIAEQARLLDQQEQQGAEDEA